MIDIREKAGNITFAVKVLPRANRSEIVDLEGECVRIRLNAPPVEGRANEELVRFLADLFRISRSSVQILSGDSSRRKLVRLRGVSAQQLKTVARSQ